MKKSYSISVILVILLSIIFLSLFISADGDSLTIYTEMTGKTDPLDSDSDNDGLEDDLEIRRYNTDPTNKDTDNDNLTDGLEVNKYNTDPTNKDTDNDNLFDYEEINNYGTNPINSDTDGDNLLDYKEIKEYNTDPTNKDTDNDNLTDGLEVNKYNTDPTNKDTDNDNLTDGLEVNKYNTDPTNKDTDNDNLADDLEVNKYNTNPINSDTDSDNLLDYKEINNYGTDPTSKDTDDDNLTDYEEINNYGTDPTSKDTDNDNLTDYEEIKEYNSDPTSKDADGDGIEDYGEVLISQKFNNINPKPSRKDILLEVDYQEGHKPNNFTEVKKKFKNANINNYNNQTGINLEIIYDDKIDIKEETSIIEYKDNIYEDKFDNKGYGFYHALIVHNTGDRSVSGVTLTGIDGMIVQKGFNNEFTSVTLMHELGHQLGLYPDDYIGIDSNKISYENYPSVMNYNTNLTNIQYSTNNRFNDWNHINNSLRQNAPDTGKINELK